GDESLSEDELAALATERHHVAGEHAKLSAESRREEIAELLSNGNLSNDEHQSLLNELEGLDRDYPGDDVSWPDEKIPYGRGHPDWERYASGRIESPSILLDPFEWALGLAGVLRTIVKLGVSAIAWLVKGGWRQILTAGLAAMRWLGSMARQSWHIIKDSVRRVKGNRGAVSRAPAWRTGPEYEKHVRESLGAGDGFRHGGREFDGALGDTWLEVKSWSERSDHWLSNWESLQNQLGAEAALARRAGKSFALVTPEAVPPHVSEWLAKKGIEHIIQP
ncbi:MAG: hypothetical protein ACF8SC_04865, partial [Phycisphaerales bacterium JB037]